MSASRGPADGTAGTPPQARPGEAALESDFAALCHRLGSSLGTLVNHVFLLEMDAEILPPAARESLAATKEATQGARCVLDVARRRLDAQVRTIAPRALPLHALGDRLGASLQGERVVHVDADALASMCADARAHASSLSFGLKDEYLVLRAPLDASVPAQGESTTRLLAPFAARPLAPRWGCARLLAERLGGRVRIENAGEATPVLAIQLPLDRA